MYGFAGAFAMLAGLFTWVLGFEVAPHQSFVTTTLALMICLGGFWLLDRRKRRWSWVLELVAVPLGFYFNFVSPYFPLPAVLIGVSLLFVVLAALVPEPGPANPADSDEQGVDGDDAGAERLGRR